MDGLHALAGALPTELAAHSSGSTWLTMGAMTSANSSSSASALGQSDSGGRNEPRNWCWRRTSVVRSSASGREWMPVTTTTPLRASSGKASLMVSGTPVASNTTSNGALSVCGAQAAASGCCATSTSAPKPMRRSTSSRGASLQPLTTTCAAPAWRASTAMPWPMVPGPITSTRLPLTSPATRKDCMEIDTGSASAASSSPSPCGTGTQLRAGTRTQGANAPSRVMPRPVRRSQASALPAEQAAHWPQVTEGRTTTRRPWSAPEAITPTNSWPSVTGRLAAMNA